MAVFDWVYRFSGNSEDTADLGGGEELLPDAFFFQSFAYAVGLSVAAGRSALLSGEQTERCNKGILVCCDAPCKLDGVTFLTDRVC